MTRSICLAPALGLTLLCTLVSLPAAGQVLESGHEEEFAELLGAGAPCAFLGASIESDHIEARFACGELRIVHRQEAHGGEGTAAGSFFIEGPRALREFVAPRLLEQDALWSSPTPMRSEPRYLEQASPYIAGALFVLLLLGFKAPERRPHRHRLPLWLAMGFVAVAALGGPFGSLHEHHTFLARLDCAAAVDCFSDRPGWYAPIYALYAPLVAALPPTLAALSALSLALTLIALWSMFEWVLAVSNDPFAAGTAVMLVALHPAVPRLAASLSFWPMALALLFCALRLSVVSKTGRMRERLAALAAWGLTLCSSAAFTTLLPLSVIVTLASRKMRQPMLLAFLAVVVGLAAAYAAPFIGGPSMSGMAHAFAMQALFEPSIVPLGLALATLTGIFAAARDSRRRAWLLLLAPAFILGFPLSVGYPTVFLHAFPLLFVYGAFAGLALSAPKSSTVRGLLFSLVLLSYIGADESRSFATYESPMGHELFWLHQAIPELPPHERLVLGPVIHDAMDGFQLEGDPIEVRFPRRLHQTHHQATVLSFDEWLREGSPIDGTLVYLGLAEQLFHPREQSETSVQYRPETNALLQRFDWENVATATVDTTCDAHVIMCAQEDRTQVRFLRPTKRR